EDVSVGEGQVGAVGGGVEVEDGVDREPGREVRVEPAHGVGVALAARSPAVVHGGDAVEPVAPAAEHDLADGVAGLVEVPVVGGAPGPPPRLGPRRDHRVHVRVVGGRAHRFRRSWGSRGCRTPSSWSRPRGGRPQDRMWARGTTYPGPRSRCILHPGGWDGWGHIMEGAPGPRPGISGITLDGAILSAAANASPPRGRYNCRSGRRAAIGPPTGPDGQSRACT